MSFFEKLATGDTVELLEVGPFTITARCTDYDQVCSVRPLAEASVLPSSLVATRVGHDEQC